MTAQRLTSYLKTYRKRSGLTQREVAFLIGWKQGEQFSRYERQRVIPTLQVALACAAIFGVPVQELFPGVTDPIAREISARIETLAAELQKKNAKGKDARLTARKLSWLVDNHGHLSPSNQ